jgi:hypothetical protein
MALLAFHRNVGPIRKQTEAKYGAFADLHTVLEAVTPALLDQGLLLSQSMEPTADGGCLLRTEVTHAPTGDKLSSSCPVPSLASLLLRVHELRADVLRRFPLDMPLAAAGAVPPTLPARHADPSAELPPPPPRPPGLRLDDQLKGLYTLLGQLGTTTNPLHSLGGTITYLRRYQILSLLSLAPADDDGNGGPTCAPQADHPALLQPQRSAAAPPRSRTRRTPATQGGARPQPTPAPQPAAAAPATAAPAAQADPGAATPQPQPASGPAASQATPASASSAATATPASAVATTAPAAPQPATPDALTQGHALTPAEVQELIALIRTLPTESIPHLVTAFRQQFQLPAQALVSDYIRNHEHAVFIRSQVAAMAPAAA